MRDFSEGKVSLNGFTWQVQEAPERIIQMLMQRENVSEIVARLLALRGLEIDTVDEFLYPKLKTHLPNPNTLKDMQKSVERVADAILAHEPIGIMGDYDVDGATSTAILKMFLQGTGTTVYTFIPDREDGYGPNAKKMAEYKELGCSVVLTADCGTTAYEAIESGTNLGLDVIILDHHNAEVVLPKCYAVVNPKRLDEPVDHPCRHLAACGVVFLFVVALNAELRKRGFYADKTEPNLMKYLDLVAFGTVCDVVQLRGVNRLLVKSGLQQAHLNHNKGLYALCQCVNINEPIQTYHLGYILGPRVNACGRVGKSDLGMQLLSCSDEIQASLLAQELDGLNLARREIEADVMLQAIEQVESGPSDRTFLAVKGKNWHQGVVGIVAGRLKDRYNLPVLVMSIEGEDVKGSARSVAGIDMGTLIMNALAKGLLTRGGGHPMAAGFSLTTEQLPAFEDYLKETITADKLPSGPAHLNADGILDLGGITWDFAEQLDLLAPYGEGNPEPNFIIQNVTLNYVNLLKNGHIGCSLTNTAGQHINAIAFKVADTDLGQTFLSSTGERFHILGTIKKDVWNGRQKVQVHILDAMRA